MKKLKVLFSTILILFLISGTALAQNLKIYCIDVDQGMSTLIVTPNCVNSSHELRLTQWNLSLFFGS